VLAYGVVSEKLSPTSLLGDAVETFVRREAAERFIEEVQRDDPVDPGPWPCRRRPLARPSRALAQAGS